MLEDVIEGFKGRSLWGKIVFIKRVLVEVMILSICAVMLFWATFAFLAMLSLFISPEPYYHEFSPLYHVRQIRPDSLFTLFVNQQLKEAGCTEPDLNKLFGELTVPYHEFCNLKQETLPPMEGYTDVTISGVDAAKVRYVTGCTRVFGEGMSCQKYPVTSTITLFRRLQLKRTYFVQVQLHLYDSNSVPYYTGLVQMTEECSFVTRFIKDHYHLFTLLLTYGLTFGITLSAILVRISFLAKDYILQAQGPTVKKQL